MTGSSPGRMPAVAKSLALAGVLLLALELALHLGGAGFSPRFFVRGEDGHLHANPHFGRLFFPERLVREGVAVRLADPKPTETFRLFVLGESAAMGFPSPRFGFPRVLEIILREGFPGKNIEVLNVAMAGINSHAVRRIAKECAQLEPDAFVIYLGNNEVVGPFGPGTVFGGATTSLAQARASMALRTSKTGQLLDGLLDQLAGRDETRWGGMAMFAEQRVPQDHAAMPSVYANFRTNLREILDLTAEKPTILCTVAVNLEDFPPLAGEEARRVYAEAEAATSRGDDKEARALFSRARDLDALRFRADSTINRIVREESVRPKVTLVDAEETFAAGSHARRDAELFWEHVHLDFPGNYLLAESVAAALAPAMTSFFGTAPLAFSNAETVARKIGYTASEQLYAANDIARMLAELPFTTQPGNEGRRRALAERAAQLNAAWQAADLATLEAELTAEVARYPADPWQRVALATVLDARGNRTAALEQKRSIARLIPYDVTALSNLGRAEMAAGNNPAAKESLKRAAKLDPYLAKPVIDLAACAMRENQPREAAQILEHFLRRDPGHVDVLLALAQIALHENRPHDAKQYLTKALRNEPENAKIRAELSRLEK